MKHTLLLIVAIGLMVGMLMLGFFFTRPQANVGSAPAGLSATASTSQFLLAAGTAMQIAATSTSCAGRVVGTQTALQVTLNDAAPTLGQGFPVAASTTFPFDGGVYGCGAVRVISLLGQTITFSQTR